MRGSDVGKGPLQCALPALWVGLLYDDAALDAAWSLVRRAIPEQRQQLRHDVPKLGLKAKFLGRPLQALAKDVLEIARKSLISRGFGEEAYLGILDEEAQSGLTQADRLLELYHGAWKGEITPVFKAAAF